MGTLNDSTPVLVGVAAVQQKQPDPALAQEAVALMAEALLSAAADAGDTGLLAQLDEIAVPKGIWGYSDPARLLAAEVGARRATSTLGEIGVLQQTLMSRACGRIAAGEADVVAVVGGEAKYRALCAQKAGTEAADTDQADAVPDVRLEPDSELWSEVESATGLGMPVGFYAIIDSALRYKQGLSVDEHRDQMAQMYRRFSELAAANPDAWSDEPVSAAQIRDAGAGNRMLAFPYTKYHNSQWNVDQAGALIFTSVGKARELGIDESRWVFPVATTESNFMSVVAERGDLGGCAGFRHAGAEALRLANRGYDEVHLAELYSCFPAAVRSQLHEFGLTGAEDFTVTGAMPFGGGPLNNFVLQSTIRMVQLLRERPGELGLVTSVSGMLTKQACALWSTRCDAPWQFADVTEAVRNDTVLKPLVADYEGRASVAGYTVLYQGDAPWRGVAVLDLPGDRRTVAYTEDEHLIEQMLTDECCGSDVQVAAGQFS